jgi:hypothetical protein
MTAGALLVAAAFVGLAFSRIDNDMPVVVQMWKKGRRHFRSSFLILLSQREKQKLPNLLAEPG